MNARAPDAVRAFVAAVAAACAMATAPAPAHAATVPWGTKTIDRVYEQKDLRELLRELAASQNLVANVDSGVPAVAVSGRFNMSAGQLFRYLSSTHGLIHYYAGNVLYVYPASASVTEVVQVAPDEIPRVMRALGDFKLVDPQYPIKVNRREGVLLVSGPRSYVDMVRRMAKATPGVETGPIEVRVFPLRYASAADQTLRRGGRDLVTPGVVAVMRQVFTRGQVAPVRRETSKMREAFSRPHEAATATVANTDIELRLPPRMPTPQELAGGDDARPAVADAGGESANLPQIVADTRLNAVVVRDLVARMPEHEALVRTLDVRQAAVEIEVSVIEVASDDLDSLGMDWRFHSSRIDMRSGRHDLPDERFPSSLPPSSGRPYDPGPLLGAAASMGGVLTTVLTDGGRQFLSRINALTSDGKASFKATPKVLTLNNSEAVLERMKTFFAKVPGTYQSQLYDVSVGTSMSVVPTLVAEEGGDTQIRLVVKIEDGELTSQTVDQLPVITRNAIGTQAYVGVGQSLLIAGYREDATKQVESGVPGLSKVPVLGWLFKQRETTGGQLERLYMITPRVLAHDAVARGTRGAPPDGTPTAGAAPRTLPPGVTDPVSMTAPPSPSADAAWGAPLPASRPVPVAATARPVVSTSAPVATAWPQAAPPDVTAGPLRIVLHSSADASMPAPVPGSVQKYGLTTARRVVAGQTRHEFVLGPFTSRAEAQRALEQVRSRFPAAAIVGSDEAAVTGPAPGVGTGVTTNVVAADGSVIARSSHDPEP